MKNLKDRTLLFNKEIINNNLELDYLSKVDIDFDNFTILDTDYTVKQHQIGRMDLISFEVYSSPYYWWLICQRNNIIDPLTEMYTGMIIKIPALPEYFDFYNKNIKIKEKITQVFDKRKIT